MNLIDIAFALAVWFVVSIPAALLVGMMLATDAYPDKRNDVRKAA